MLIELCPFSYVTDNWLWLERTPRLSFSYFESRDDKCVNNFVNCVYKKNVQTIKNEQNEYYHLFNENKNSLILVISTFCVSLGIIKTILYDNDIRFMTNHLLHFLMAFSIVFLSQWRTWIHFFLYYLPSSVGSSEMT